MSEVKGNYDTQEEYIGRVGNDMCYPKPTEPQAHLLDLNKPTPENDLTKIVKAFDEVDIRKISDADLRFYMDVAYYSYLYAEALINKRERLGKSK